MIEAPSTAALGSPGLQRLDDYWRAQRSGREMPRRADIDPIGLKPILPKVILSRIDAAAQRLQYTVVGTHCVAMAGMDFTGHFLDELELGGEADTNWPQLYQRLLRERQPIFGTCQVMLVNGQTRPYVSGLYPLGDDQGHISHIIELKDTTLEPSDRRLLQPAVPMSLRKSSTGHSLGGPKPRLVVGAED